MIEHALFSADAVFALLTPDFPQSKWTDQKVGVAVGREILVVPVKVGLDPYGLTGKYQAYQGMGKKIANVAAGVAKILSTHEKTAARMASALVGQFESSDTFASAKDGIAKLEDLPILNVDIVNRLRKTVATNDQINGSYGVPRRVEALIQKFLE